LKLKHKNLTDRNLHSEIRGPVCRGAWSFQCICLYRKERRGREREKEGKREGQQEEERNEGVRKGEENREEARGGTPHRNFSFSNDYSPTGSCDNCEQKPQDCQKHTHENKTNNRNPSPQNLPASFPNGTCHVSAVSQWETDIRAVW
jgi:hypothetical protein